MRTLTLCAALLSVAAAPAPQRIKNGAHVVTTTETTGTYFVEDAEPGDLIVVTIETLEPKSDTGTSASVMTPNSIVPGSLGTKGAPVTWMIDKSKRVVRFDLQKAMPNVDWAARYAPPIYELPLAPMLASIGTAPGDRIAMAGAGAKVLLPVNEPGALLVLGHGL